MVRDGPQCTQFRWPYGVAMGAGRGNSCPRRRGGAHFLPPPPAVSLLLGTPGCRMVPKAGEALGELYC